MQLTEHFTLEEFTRSATAERLHIPNTPNTLNIQNLRTLCSHVLEPLRQYVGEPVIISSGYRCNELNKAVGGVSGSQHTKGEAADIRIPDAATGKEWFTWIMDNLEFDQLIWETKRVPNIPNNPNTPNSTHWIHVSYREDHNRQTLVRNLVKK